MRLWDLQKPGSSDRTEKSKIVARGGKAAAVVEWLLGTGELPLK